MQSKIKNMPITFLILIALILIGNIGFSYIIGLIVGSAEFQVINLIGSILLFGACSFLSLRIIYQMDRQGSRLKRRISLFEPRGDDS